MSQDYRHRMDKSEKQHRIIKEECVQHDTMYMSLKLRAQY